ncbi:hypothetical protein COB52_01790 [Candidatus Kaiserbacteria bacterium]|nr:MAG: hypothetical protein COB52_01790 [Candidatus Kaiserbacteria bacterium]
MQKRNYKNSIRTILFLAPILLLLSLAPIFVQNDKSHEPIFEIDSYKPSEDKNYLRDLILEDGSLKAYSYFVEQNVSTSFGIRHLRAHIIGELIFEHEGVSGVSVCDSSFGFGCFHGLFTIGFSSLGTEFIKVATDVCVEQYGVMGAGCQHGIGHGIVEYLGVNNLKQALELCENTSQLTPLLGCTSGVFMEHNTPSSFSIDGEVPDPYKFTKKSPYAECKNVLDKYKPSCYYELGGWWEVVLQGDRVKMGELCSKIQDKQLRDSCSLGLGDMIGVRSEYNADESSNTCFKMAENVISMCHAGVAWSMFSNPEYRSLAPEVCDRLLDNSKVECNNFYNLSLYTFTYGTNSN